MKKVFFSLLALICLASCADTAALDESLQKIASLEAELAEAKNQLDKAGPTDLAFVHNVYFWLKEGITKAEEKAFLEGLVSLKAISSIGQFYYGPPAGTPRDVVDNSYDYALSIHFKDKAAQDAYQVDPIHTAFVEKLADHWTKVQVYDNTLMGD